MRRLCALVLVSATMGCDDTNFGEVTGEAVEGEGLEAVIAVYNAECISCHTGTASGGLDLVDDPCATTVDVDSVGYSGKLVVPGDAEASVLFHKVDDSGESGGVMPIAGRMADGNVQIIRDWIDAGAEGCDGSGGGSGDGGGSSDGGGDDGPDISAGGHTAVVNVFDDACIACHSGDAAAGGVPLDGDLCADLVGVPSTGYAGNLIVAGDSASSIVFSKMANTGSAGGVMPPGGELDGQYLDVVADWIDAGAACDGGGR